MDIRCCSSGRLQLGTLATWTGSEQTGLAQFRRLNTWLTGDQHQEADKHHYWERDNPMRDTRPLAAPWWTD